MAALSDADYPSKDVAQEAEIDNIVACDQEDKLARTVHSLRLRSSVYLLIILELLLYHNHHCLLIIVL